MKFENFEWIHSLNTGIHSLFISTLLSIAGGAIARGRKLQLWEFLFELLRGPDKCRSLEWVDEDNGVFRIASPQLLALQWGSHRSRKSMTYDKLSRTMRYYYAKSIITKVPNMNRTYKFHYEKMKDLRGKEWQVVLRKRNEVYFYLVNFYLLKNEESENDFSATQCPVSL